MDSERQDQEDFGPGGGAHPDAPWNQQPEEPAPDAETPPPAGEDA